MEFIPLLPSFIVMIIIFMMTFLYLRWRNCTEYRLHTDMLHVAENSILCYKKEEEMNNGQLQQWLDLFHLLPSCIFSRPVDNDDVIMMSLELQRQLNNNKHYYDIMQ